jgi:hypothetical protein
MVIVYTSIKNIYLITNSKGNILLFHKFTFLLIYLTYAQKDVFSLFFLY